MRPPKHDCNEHIVRRVPPTSKPFASGGVPTHVCSICRLPVVMRFGPRDVLARASARAVS